MSTLKINKAIIDNYKTSFDDSKTSFNSGSYNKFKNSYLATCSDSTVQAMYSNLNSLYSKINSGYDSINDYWTGFNEDSSSLEVSLETDNNVCSNANVGCFLSSFLGTLTNLDYKMTDSLGVTADKINVFAKKEENENNNSDTESSFKDFEYIRNPLTRKVARYCSLAEAQYAYFQMSNSDYYIEDFDYYSMTPKEKYILSIVAPDMNESNYSDYLEYIIYLKQVENMYGDDIEEAKAAVLIEQLAEIDKERNYKLLHSTPFLIKGTTHFLNGSFISDSSETDNAMLNYDYEGDYLLYYNEDGVRVIAPLSSFEYGENGAIKETVWVGERRERIIKNNTKYYNSMMYEVSKYPEEYRKTVFKKGDQITLINGHYSTPDEDVDAQASTYYLSNGRTNVILRTDPFMNEETNFNIDEDEYKYAVGTFNHEVGHKYDNAVGRISDSEEWEEFYKQICEADSNNSKTREYAKYSKAELLAECMAEYYNYDGTASLYYAPNDLKDLKIDITVDGVHYDNAYDYIDKVIVNK